MADLNRCGSLHSAHEAGQGEQIAGAEDPKAKGDSHLTMAEASGGMQREIRSTSHLNGDSDSFRRSTRQLAVGGTKLT
jgi:hypothetical protein